jgi:hypothetical protein
MLSDFKDYFFLPEVIDVTSVVLIGKNKISENQMLLDRG